MNYYPVNVLLIEISKFHFSQKLTLFTHPLTNITYKQTYMFKKLSINSIYNVIVVILLLVAVAIRGGATFEWLKPHEDVVYSLSDIQKVISNAAKLKENSDQSISILDENNNVVSKALYSRNFDAKFQGYAGETPLMIYFNKENLITEVQLLNNEESPEYIDHVAQKGLFNSWTDLPVDTITALKSVDAITGATYSSNAIIKTAQKTMGNYLAIHYQSQSLSFKQVVQPVLTIILLLVSLSMLLKKWFRKYYWYYLVAVLGVFGLWLKQMLSTETLYNWLVKGLPWQSNWELIVVLILAVAMGLLGHKNYYCTYLCPMGAIQALVSKISPFKKRGFQLKISKITLRSVYLTFIWVSLLLGFTLPLSDMEPFKAFSFVVASNIMLIAGLLIVILSLVFNRPWCQLCPTGCLLNSVPSLKTKKKYNHEK